MGCGFGLFVLNVAWRIPVAGLKDYALNVIALGESGIFELYIILNITTKILIFIKFTITKKFT